MKLESQPPRTTKDTSRMTQGSGQATDPARRTLQGLAAQAGRASGGASNHGQDASARTNDRDTGSTSTRILLTLTILGAVGTAWGIYSHGTRDTAPIVERPPETRAILERDAACAQSSTTDGVERVPVRSAQPAFERVTPTPPERRFAPNESSESSDEDEVLQALAEPDAETRYLRLWDAVYGGAEIPVDRLHEVLATDPSNQVRQLALNALTEHPEATPEQVRAMAESALADASLAVRARAQRILDQMDEFERMDREARQMSQVSERQRAR